MMRVKLGTAVTVVMGQAPAASACNKSGNGTPFVKVREFGAERPIIREWTTDPKKMARETDVLICVVGTCGKINLGADCAIGRSVAAIRPRTDRLEQRYLWYFMQGQTAHMRATSQGSAQTVITRKMIADIDIPLPPVPVQRRILGVLDEVFAEIGAAAANIQKNVGNAQELAESYVRQTFTNSSDAWSVNNLGSLCQNLDSKRVPVTKKDRIPGNVPYYGASGPVDYVRDYIFDEELLLVSEDGANLLTRTYPIAFSVSGKSWVNNHAHVLRFPDRATQRLVEYYLNSISLSRFVSGMAQPKLNQAALNKIPIPLPPAEEREDVVEALERVSEDCARLIECYSQKLKLLTELKESILHRAFNGDISPAEALAA
jgi:type I restriction enzyme, S subunit